MLCIHKLWILIDLGLKLLKQFDSYVEGVADAFAVDFIDDDQERFFAIEEVEWNVADDERDEHDADDVRLPVWWIDNILIVYTIHEILVWGHRVAEQK